MGVLFWALVATQDGVQAGGGKARLRQARRGAGGGGGGGDDAPAGVFALEGGRDTARFCVSRALRWFRPGLLLLLLAATLSVVLGLEN